MLFLTEPIDEPALNNIGEFGDFKFVDVTREDLDLGDVAEDDKKKVSVNSLAGKTKAPKSTSVGLYKAHRPHYACATHLWQALDGVLYNALHSLCTQSREIKCMSSNRHIRTLI